MKYLKKFTVLLLAALLLLNLAGCGMIGMDRTPQQDRERLQAILDDLASNLHPGTAGSSLTSARLAADLIAWAATTKMDKKEAAQIVGDWLKVQSPEIRAAFQEKLASVGESYGRILKDGASDLMDAAGIEEDFSNLGSKLKEIVSAILASGGLD